MPTATSDTVCQQCQDDETTNTSLAYPRECLPKPSAVTSEDKASFGTWQIISVLLIVLLIAVVIFVFVMRRRGAQTQDSTRDTAAFTNPMYESSPSSKVEKNFFSAPDDGTYDAGASGDDGTYQSIPVDGIYNDPIGAGPDDGIYNNPIGAGPDDGYLQVGGVNVPYDTIPYDRAAASVKNIDTDDFSGFNEQDL